jgi:hypothetical protein
MGNDPNQTSEGGHSFLHYPTTSTVAVDPLTLFEINFGDKAELEYMFEEMRRRQLTVVAMQGQDTILLPRLVYGTRCPFWKSEEENCTSPLDSRATCYNTGWVGGYNPPIIIKVVIPPANRTAIFYEEGVRKEFSPRPWTIHTPPVRERDLLISRTSGERYEVLSLSNTMLRGLPMHQEFDMRLIPHGKESYAYQVPVTLQ